MKPKMSKRIDNLGKYAKGGPGRPKGSLNWKNRVLQMIGEVYGDNETEIKEHLRTLAKDNTDKFLTTYVLPFVPKESSIDINSSEGGITFVLKQEGNGNGNGHKDN